jgi:hypothetical protein
VEKLFLFRKRKVRTVNILDQYPYRIYDKYEEHEGKVTICIPKFRRVWMQRFLIPSGRGKEFRVRLDELGSAVWLLIDGKRSVQEIADVLKSTFGERIQPAEERVGKYLKDLFGKYLIGFKETNNK